MTRQPGSGSNVACTACGQGERLISTLTEQWSSRTGFVLAAVGAAVGLGNIWRFSYVAGDNGGSTFLLVYLLTVLLVGVPILIAELALGRHARGDAVAVFRRLTSNRLWILGGFLGILGSSLVMCFYFVVAGWVFKYLYGALTGSLWSLAGDHYGGYFDAFIADPLAPIGWQLLVVALAALVVGTGVQQGIEKMARTLMPLLATLLVGLALFSAVSFGAQGGLAFLFSPDWSLLASPKIYLAAVGQAFFSLSIGMALFITYGSYLAESHRIPGAALTVVAGDTLIALAAGILVFSAVFAYGMHPDAGPRLVFITLPQVFLAMPAGEIVGALFFTLLAAAALSASISGLEVPVAYVMRRFKLGRRAAATCTGATLFVCGLPAALGYGLLDDARWGDRRILESMDVLVSNFVLPLAGLLTALFAGWGWGAVRAMEESDLGTRLLGKIWLFCLRVVAPLFIAAAALASFFNE